MGKHYPPSRKVENITERKNLHIHVYGVNEFGYLSVHKFNTNYLRNGYTEWAKEIVTSMAKSHVSKK